jgi:stage III sporulation protein AE
MTRRNKQIILILISIIVALFVVNLTVFAYANEDEEELNYNLSLILGELDLSELDEYLKGEGDSYLYNFGDTAEEIIEYLFRGNVDINYTEYISGLLKIIFNNVISLIPSFAQVIALGLFCAIISGAEGSIMGKSTSKIIKFSCYCLIMLILISNLTGIISSAINCISNLKRQIEIITPILITLTVLTGGTNAGAIYQPSALFLSSGAVELVKGFVFPATIAVVVLNCLSKLNGDISFTGVTKLIKSILKWVLGITVTIFSLFVTMQSAASSLFDGIFFKTTKYLVGNSVPIVGNFLSSGVDMIVSAGSIIKSSVGLVGIILIIGEIIGPVTMLAAYSLILKFVAAIVQPMGEEKLFSLLGDLSSDIEYFIAGLLIVAFMYALIIMLMINCANYFL